MELFFGSPEGLLVDRVFISLTHRNDKYAYLLVDDLIHQAIAAYPQFDLIVVFKTGKAAGGNPTV